MMDQTQMEACERVFKTLKNRQVSALMFHQEMADLFDFLGLMGFKRLHEYQYLSESLEHRSTCRYYLNHHNKLLMGSHIDRPEVIPAGWEQYTRFDVTPQIRRQAVEQAFHKYQDWESNTKEVYSQCAKDLMDYGMVADSYKVGELIKDVDMELKTLDRLILKLQAISYDAVGMMDMQEELHECYRQRTKELGIDIC